MKIELIHDSLARKIFEKATTEDKMRLKVERFIKDQFKYYKERKLHLDKDELGYIRPYLKDIDLSPEELDFIHRSEKRERWRQIRVLVGIAAFAGLLLVFGVYMSVARLRLESAHEKVIQEERRAKSLYWLSESRKALQEGNVDLAFRLAESAYLTSGMNSTDIADHLFDIQQYRLKAKFRHTNKINSIRYSADSTKLITAGEDGRVKIWGVRGDLSDSIVERKHNFVFADFLQTSTTVVTVTDSGLVGIWENSQFPSQLIPTKLPTRSAVLSPNGQAIFLLGAQHSGALAPVLRGKSQIIATKKPILFAAFSADSQLLMYAEGGSPTIEILNIVTQQKESYDVGSAVVAACLLPNSSMLAAVGDKGVVTRWQLGSIDSPLVFILDKPAKDLVVSSDGIRLAVVHHDTTIQLFNSDLKPIRLLVSPAPVQTCVFSPDNKSLAYATSNKLYVSDINGNLLDFLELPSPPTTLLFSPSGDRLVTIGITNTEALVWSVRENEYSIAPNLYGFRTDPDQIFLTADRIVLADTMSNVLYWSFNGELMAKIPLSTPIQSLDVSVTGDTVLTGTTEGVVQWWDSLGNLLQTIKFPRPLLQVGFCNYSKHLFVMTGENRVLLYDIAKKTHINIDSKRTEQVFANRYALQLGLVTGGRMQVVNEKGDEIALLQVGDLPIEKLLFEKTATKVLVQKKDNELILMDLETREIETLKHTAQVISVAFVNADQNIIATTADGNVKFWNLEGNIIRILEHGFEQGVVFGANAPQTRRTATVMANGSIKIWNEAGKKQIDLFHDGAFFVNFKQDEQRVISVGGNQIKYWRFVTPNEIMDFYRKTTRYLNDAERTRFNMKLTRQKQRW